MATKTKLELKTVFNDVCDLYYQKTNIDLSKGTITLAPELNLPVTVDTLKITQDSPTINHYKVIGLDADWTSSSTAGDMSVELTVPSVNEEIIKTCFGESAYAQITKASITTGDTTVDNGATGYEGYAWEASKYKMEGTFVFVEATKNNLFVVTNLVLYATFLYDNTSTEPIAFKLTGTVEGAGQKSFAYLKKKAA